MTERKQPRVNGYYWVRVKDALNSNPKWEPAWYIFRVDGEDEWDVCGSEIPYCEDELLEVGSQITRSLNETF